MYYKLGIPQINYLLIRNDAIVVQYTLFDKYFSNKMYPFHTIIIDKFELNNNKKNSIYDNLWLIKVNKLYKQHVE